MTTKQKLLYKLNDIFKQGHVKNMTVLLDC